MNLVEAVIAGKIEGGPGGEVTPGSVVTATAAMTPSQAAQTVQNLGIPGAVYDGVDLTVKFADEIAAAPYNGNECAWIKAREQAGNYAGINVGDYIPLTTTNGYTFRTRIMGIDTYTGYGNEVHIVGHHIDWNWDELWPEAIKMNYYNYNNGLIPTETITADGDTTEFTLTKEMSQVDTIKRGTTELSGWTYDPATYKITFEEAPASGNLTIIGTGTEYPWNASNGFAFANSCAGQVPYGENYNPDVHHVDYTQDGIYYYLPQKWKDIIVPKFLMIGSRYSVSDLVSQPNGYDFVNLGNIWTLTDVEIFGTPMAANQLTDRRGSYLHYPLFNTAKRFIKTVAGQDETGAFWLINPYSYSSGSKTYWSAISERGVGYSYLASSDNVYFPVCFRT